MAWRLEEFKEKHWLRGPKDFWDVLFEIKEYLENDRELKEEGFEGDFIPDLWSYFHAGGWKTGVWVNGRKVLVELPRRKGDPCKIKVLNVSSREELDILSEQTELLFLPTEYDEHRYREDKPFDAEVELPCAPDMLKEAAIKTKKVLEKFPPLP